MTELVVVCDGCGRRSAPVRNAGMKITMIRGQLRLAGWESLHGRGRDYCPACARGGRAAKAKGVT